MNGSEDLLEGTMGPSDELISDESINQLEFLTQALTDRDIQVRLEKEWWERTFNAVSDLIMVLDQVGTVIKMNQACLNALPQSYGDPIGKKCFELFCGKYRCEECPFNGVLSPLIERKILKSPKLLNDRWYEITLDPVFDNTRKPIGCIHIGRDITERKEAEELSDFSKKRWIDLIENMPNGSFSIGFDGVITFVNEAFSKLIRLDKENLVGRNIGEFVPEKWKSIGKIAFQALQENGFVTPFEQEFLTAEGNLIPVETSGYVMQTRPGENPSIFVFVHNISHRKAAEKVIKDANHQLSIFNRISKIFLTQADSEMYSSVLDVLLEEFGAEFGFFGYVDESRSLIVPSMTKNIWEVCQVQGKEYTFSYHSWEGTIWGEALRTGKTIVENDSSKIEVPQGHLSVNRTICVPIKHDGTVIGIFALANREAPFTIDDEMKIEQIAENVAPVLHARLQRDAKARESAEIHDLLSTILKATTAAVGKTKGRKLIWGNSRLEEMTGYKIEEFEGRTTRFLYETQEEYDRVGLMRFDRAISGVGQVETTWLRKDGGKVDILLSSVRSGEEDEVIFTAVDIGNIKRVENDLRRAKQMLKSTLQAIQDPVVVVDKELKIIHYNKAAEELFGKDKIDTKLPFCYNCPERRKKPCKNCSTIGVFETGVVSVSDKFDPESKKHYVVTTSPVFDESGKVCLVVQHLKDVTTCRENASRANMLNDTLLSFGEDNRTNIDSLVTTLNLVLSSSCVIYHQKASFGGLVHVAGDWDLPKDFNLDESQKKYLCRAVPFKKGSCFYYIGNLTDTPFAESDPNVKKYHFKSYLSSPVVSMGKHIGYICVFYTEEHEPTMEDLNVLKLVSLAIGLEEQKYQQKILRFGAKQRLERIKTLLESDLPLDESTLALVQGILSPTPQAAEVKDGN